MLDFIYTLLIAPLEYWMHAALVWGYSHTQAWGPAIVVMSLAVNFVILPIYIKAESWQEGERAIRKGFEAKEAMIKRTFKGQERFAMITTMHRQAGYSPFLTLRSSLGFFLQIPFFFAAYHFLSHFEPLSGVSFIGIGDLSKPDALIDLGVFSINVLPIVMTVINLASALVYTHNMTRKDKMQLYGMAAIFLVLLYDAASGLVLYWTCNNIFSLGKNIVYSLFDRVRPAAAAVLLRMRALLPKPRQEVFSGGVLYAVPLLFWLIGTAVALLSSNQVFFIEEVWKYRMSLLSDFVYMGYLLVSVLLAIKLKLWRKHWVLVLLTLVAAYYSLRMWGKWYFYSESRRSWALSTGLLYLIPALGVLHAGIDLRRCLYSVAHSARSTKPAETLLAPAGIWLTLLLAAYLPVQAYCTAVEIFSEPEVILAKSLMWCAIIGVAIWIFAFWATCVRSRNFAGYFLGALTLLLTVYAFLLPLNTGTIDAFQISNPAPLFSSVNLLVDVAVIAAVFGIYAWLIKSGRTLWVKTVFVLCIVGSLVNGTYLLWQTRGQWQTDPTQKETAVDELPDYNDRLFGFSQTGENIVVVMLDAFTGTHMPRILESNPELKTELDGFVWYPDAVSPGSQTHLSVAAILCGKACMPLELNASGTDPLPEKINRNYAKVINRLGAGWDVAIHERNWLEEMRLRRYTQSDVLALRYLSNAYVDRYIQKNDLEIGRGNTDAFLLAVSVYSSVPWGLKNQIYRDGRWFESLIGNKNEVLALRFLKDWAVLDQLPELSNANARKNTFKFIDSELTHSPWFMDPGVCQIVTNPKREISKDGVPLSHVASETCALQALARWFDWMKEAGVWDNTTIVIASDHSAGDDPSYNKAWAAAGVNSGPRQANALLLVKRAGQKGELKTDLRPTTAARVAGMWTGEKFVEDMRTHVFGRAKGDQFLIEKVWRVRGSMFEPKNWTDSSS